MNYHQVPEYPQIRIAYTPQHFTKKLRRYADGQYNYDHCFKAHVPGQLLQSLPSHMTMLKNSKVRGKKNK